jgi:DNA-binding CsgD family transcriptional regulator
VKPARDGSSFGVTFATTEAELVAALGGGKTLADHAAGKGISSNTAKTLLSRAFSKTGTSRQSELVALVYADPLLRTERPSDVS